MPGLKPLPWKEFEKFLTYTGCIFVREKGDHRIWARAGLKRPVVVPKTKAIPIFVLRNNLRLLGVSVEDYLIIMEKV